MLRAFFPRLALLLRKCRQIHQDDAPMLHANNTFTMTKDHVSGWHDDNGYVFTCGFLRWLTTIGNYKLLVRKIVIDLDALCHEHCEYARHYCHSRTTNGSHGLLDFTQLLRTLWEQEIKAKIVFLQPQRESHRYWGRFAEPSRRARHPVPPAASYGCNAAALTQVLRALRSNGMDIKKYNRILSTIHVHRDGSGGLIMYEGFWNPVTPDMKYCTDFLADDGKNIRLQPRERATTFQHLSSRLRHQIFSAAVTIPYGHTINLDTAAGRQEILGLPNTAESTLNIMGLYYGRTTLSSAPWAACPVRSSIFSNGLALVSTVMIQAFSGSTISTRVTETSC